MKARSQVVVMFRLPPNDFPPSLLIAEIEWPLLSSDFPEGAHELDDELATFLCGLALSHCSQSERLR